MNSSRDFQSRSYVTRLEIAAQVFKFEPKVTSCRTGQLSSETVYGITSLSRERVSNEYLSWYMLLMPCAPLPKIVATMAHPSAGMRATGDGGTLVDEDVSIRWLAGSSPARLGGLAVGQMLVVFRQNQPHETARQEALRVLELIADADEDVAGLTAAKEAALNTMT